MFLTVFGWSLLLLPFSIASRAPDGWNTGYIIAMIVLGAVLLIAFGVWEKFFAPVSYFPWKYLKDRTILGACLLYGFMFASILYVAICAPFPPPRVHEPPLTRRFQRLGRVLLLVPSGGQLPGHDHGRLRPQLLLPHVRLY